MNQMDTKSFNMDPIKLIHNNCTKFLLPIVVKKGVRFYEIFNDGFKEAYIGDINRPELDDNILILRQEPYIDLSNHTDSIFESECLSAYTIDDGEYSNNIYVHSIPMERIDEYGKFIQGRISDFSEEYKQHLIHFWDTDKNSMFYSILYNDYKTVYKKIEETNKDRWNKIELMGLNKSLYIDKNTFQINVNLQDEILGLRVDI